MAVFGKVGKFLEEVKVELKKTSWPTRRELIDATIVIIIATAILSIFIGIVDVILSKIVSLVIK